MLNQKHSEGDHAVSAGGDRRVLPEKLSVSQAVSCSGVLFCSIVKNSVGGKRRKRNCNQGSIWNDF